VEDEQTLRGEKKPTAGDADELPALLEDIARSTGARSVDFVSEGKQLDVSQVMKMMGAIGGSRKNPRKGFGSVSPEKRREAALKGLAKRWGRSKDV